MSEIKFTAALEDFYTARRQAAMKTLLARLTNRSVDLLSYEDVRTKLKIQGSVDRGLRDIPLDSIIGSVARYSDFTRDFLPLKSVSAERWARVQVAISEDVGLDPIDVYQIGDIYFVKDGNHRVSIARQMGAKHIHAYVTEIRTRVPVGVDVKPDELILKEEYANFLEHTHLDEVRPDSDLGVSVPGQYPILEEHIAVHRYFMGLDQQREISNEEAVAHWYDTVYLPVVNAIREQYILSDFPSRTETDLYLWLSEYRAVLEKEYGRQIRPEDAARGLADQFSSKPGKRMARISGKVIDTFLPESLESGPRPGEWRKGRTTGSPKEDLFADILAPFNGRPDGWFAVKQGVIVARREHSHLHGLHILPFPMAGDNEAVIELEEEFARHTRAKGKPGSLILDTGEIAVKICEQAQWSDLVVINLSHPPSIQPLEALSSGFRYILQHCPRPVLVVRQAVTPMQNALLAYDGSPRAEEALFIATYLAGKWGISLSVISVLDRDGVSGKTINRAKKYLEDHGVQAHYYEETGPVADTLLQVTRQTASDFLLMGGYGRSPLVEVVIGSVVDKVLRESTTPVLICR